MNADTQASWSDYQELLELISSFLNERVSTELGVPTDISPVLSFSPENLFSDDAQSLHFAAIQAVEPLDGAIGLVSSINEAAFEIASRSIMRGTISALEVEGADTDENLDRLYEIAAEQTLNDPSQAQAALMPFRESPAFAIDTDLGRIQIIFSIDFLNAAKSAADTEPEITPESTAVAASSTAADSDDNDEGSQASNAGQWASLISNVEVELSAELGSTRLPLGQITNLQEHSVLTLDQLIDDPLTVLVNGVPYATARLVVVGEEYGIEIIEVLNSDASFPIVSGQKL